MTSRDRSYGATRPVTPLPAKPKPEPIKEAAPPPMTASMLGFGSEFSYHGDRYRVMDFIDGAVQIKQLSTGTVGMISGDTVVES